MGVIVSLAVLPSPADAEFGAYESLGEGEHPKEAWLAFLLWPRSDYSSPAYLCISYENQAKKKNKGKVLATACRTPEWLLGGLEHEEYRFSARVRNNKARQCVLLDEVSLGDLFFLWPCEHDPLAPLGIFKKLPKIKSEETAGISFFLSETDVAAASREGDP